MFIQQLNKKKALSLFYKLLKVVDDGCRCEIISVETSENAITITFNTGFEEQQCDIFDHSVFFSYGAYDSEAKVHKAFLKCMYALFGEKYIAEYKQHIKGKFDQQVEEFVNKRKAEYNKQLEELDEIMK
ncbi:MAG: hypothetical protein J6A28_04145 [Clostridia bacterium]|nr:hypothetical protein [Clostridia bacterium]